MVKLLIVAACLLIAVFGTAVFIANEEGRPVEEITAAVKTDSQIPLIDVIAPAQTETATFGLG